MSPPDPTNLQKRIDRALESLEDFDAVFGDKLHTLSIYSDARSLSPVYMLDHVRLILKGLE
jgi:hypothetical protein